MLYYLFPIIDTVNTDNCSKNSIHTAQAVAHAWVQNILWWLIVSVLEYFLSSFHQFGEEDNCFFLFVDLDKDVLLDYLTFSKFL